MTEYKAGDIIYLTSEYCEDRRIVDIPRRVKRLTHYKRTFDAEFEHTGYTVEYGNGGHDVYFREIDHVRTQRELKINQILQ